MRLVLDAGHGGTDPGAVSDGFHESDITLKVVLRMREKLEQLHPDWDVRLSRIDNTYISPGARARFITKVAPDAAVSVHCNSSSNASATGYEVIYREDEDYRLARELSRAMDEGLPLRDRGCKIDIVDLGRKLALLGTPGIPVIILEPGFLSNPSDREILLDIELLADVFIKGIARWAEQKIA